MTDLDCPECVATLWTEDDLPEYDWSLPAVMNENNEIFPVTANDKMRVPGADGLVPKFDRETFDMRELFLEVEDELLCWWCLWTGFRDDLE